MDDRLRISLWVVTTSSLGILLGGLFGALAGALHAHAGTTGTRFGRKVADSFARLGEEAQSPRLRGALIGAADGVLFLGLAGGLGGLAAATLGRADAQWLIMVSLGSICLVMAAAFFGLLAHTMTHRGMSTVLYVFVGGLLGSLVGGIVCGGEHYLIGTVPGLLVGLILCHATRLYSPVFRPPQAAKTDPENGSLHCNKLPRGSDLNSEESSFFRPEAGEEP